MADAATIAVQIVSDVVAQYERYQALTQSKATALYITSPDPA